MGLRRVEEITIVLVSWKDPDDTVRAIESLAAAKARVLAGGPRVSLALVDNAGGALDREAVRAIWPDASVSVNPTNRGFGPAANQAAAVAQGDVLLFVNPDTRAEGEPFSEIARAFRERGDVVAVAPRLVDDVASPEPEVGETRKRRLALRDDARELLLLDHLAPNNRFRRKFRYADRDPEQPLEVEQPAAAALAVRADGFRAAGGFDERFVPAWFEDVDLCARLRERGAILYWPAARFRHRGAASSEDLGYARFLPIYYANAIRYRRRRYGLAARAAYRALLAAGMAMRLVALPVRRRLPRPRREAAVGYLKTLALALGTKG